MDDGCPHGLIVWRCRRCADADAASVLRRSLVSLRDDLARVTAERDAAIARAEKAEALAADFNASDQQASWTAAAALRELQQYRDEIRYTNERAAKDRAEARRLAMSLADGVRALLDDVEGAEAALEAALEVLP